MKKFSFLYLALCLIILNPVSGQKSGFLNKVSKSANDILGKSDNAGQAGKAKTQPEPSCASDQATIAMDLGGKVQVDYQELSISILSDGRILAQHIGTKEYYVAKDGVTSGPFKAGDPQIADFVPKETENTDDKSEAAFLAKNKPYITKSGEKFLITFEGKKYGPYARIDYFTVSKSKDKFAALCTQTVVMTEAQGEDMETAMKNAKDDQERMELSMKYAQELSETMVKGGGAEGIKSKLISNIPNAFYDPITMNNAIPNGEVKFDDILMVTYDNKVYDIRGKMLFTMKQEAMSTKTLFVSEDNSKYAFYNSGTLNFSDNTKMTELFNPHLVKVEGKIFISYMYYSPKHSAVMQHKIPF
jgi:hypothetical protein